MIMAKLTASIQISGINVVTEAIKRFMNEAEFEETVSEEYKKGFYDFGNAVINTLEKVRSERWSENESV